MEVRCDKCQARYRIDDARVGPQGLTMRCGKCSNTFKVTRDAVQAAAAPAAPAKPAPPAPGTPVPSTAKPTATAAAAAPPPPAPPAAANPAPLPPAAAKPPAPAPAAPKGGAQATMMFSAPAGGIPTPKTTVAAAPPVPPKPAAAAKPAGPAGTSTAPAVAPLADEAAGRTMMFSAAAAMKTTPPKATIPAAKPMTKPTDDAGATMLFGAAPVLPQKPAQPPAAKPPAKDDAIGTTMLYGQGPSAAALSKPAAAAPPPAAAEPPAMAGQQPDLGASAAAEAEEHPEPSQARPGEKLEGDAVEEGAITGESEAPEGAAPGRAGPPRSVVIAVAAALGALVVLAGSLVAYKKLANRGPPPAALEALAQAQAAADKDTIASLTEAETQANAAIQAAPKGRFPQAYAALAEVEVAWSDALNDQAYFLGEKALREPDDKKKAEAEAKASALQDQAKARLKTAFDAAVVGNKMERSSPDIALALADYYRAARSRSNLNRELRRAGTLKADEARIAFVQGADFLQQDEGAQKAVEKLKAALDGAPQSARVHFRLAMAYLALRQDADATKELQQTLKLSPQHERAKMAMEAIAVASAAGEGK